MKIKMLTAMGGTSIDLVPGDVHECGDAEAIRLVKAGHALPMNKAEYEKAIKPGPAETR